MTIGLALAGIAAIAAAIHPKGARSLMGFMGTPEEHLAKFRHFVQMAHDENLPLRTRIGLTERAWAEADWTSIPPSERDDLVRLQALIEGAAVTSLPVPSFEPMRANLVARQPRMGGPRHKRSEGVDPRHPTAGWTRGHTFKGVIWIIRSIGDGQYVASSQSGMAYTGSGNSVLSRIHGHSMDFYKTTGLGPVGARFNPNSPPAGWYLRP